MKYYKKIKLILGLLITISLLSCVQDDDFSVPTHESFTKVDLASLGTKTTFNAVIDRYNSGVANGEKIGEFSVTKDTPLYIEGYVISSDRNGNFYEELIIQNTTDENNLSNDIRRGFKVEIDVSNLSNIYNYGRRVYIKLNGLAVGKSNGVYVLGKPKNNAVTQLLQFEYSKYVFRDTETVALHPKVTAIGDLKEIDRNTLIQLNNVQFNKNLIGTTFSGSATDQFDGFRVLESCDNGTNIMLQTSTFAKFKSQVLPEGKGNVYGVFSRNFTDKFNVFSVNNVEAFSFNASERCDPEVLECKETGAATTVIFKEDFEMITNESQLDALGWVNVNTSGGTERFEDGIFNGDRYIKASAFGTGELPMEAWLVTPEINVTGLIYKELSFKIASNFDNGKALTVFITNTFTGDVKTTNWTALDANIPIGDSGYGPYVSSKLNISCLDGNVRVAFKYLGGDGSISTRYHIDEIKVIGD